MKITKLVCDKCNKEIDRLSLYSTMTFQFISGKIDIQFDICENCKGKLLKWIAEKE